MCELTYWNEQNPNTIFSATYPQSELYIALRCMPSATTKHLQKSVCVQSVIQRETFKVQEGSVAQQVEQYKFLECCNDIHEQGDLTTSFALFG